MIKKINLYEEEGGWYEFASSTSGIVIFCEECGNIIIEGKYCNSCLRKLKLEKIEKEND